MELLTGQLNPVRKLEKGAGEKVNDEE